MLGEGVKLKKQRGSVSVEASIALSAFLFMFIMIYSIITICRAQAEIGNALNSSAKELSQYSYIYGLTGLDKTFKAQWDSTAGTQGEVDKLLGEINEAFNGIQSLGGTVSEAANTNLTDINGVANQWSSLVTSAENGAGQISSAVSDLEGTLSSLSEDPKSILIGLAKIFALNTLDAASSRLIAAPITRVLVKKHLKRFDDDDPNDYLHSLGVVASGSGGDAYINSIDFSRSTLFAQGKEDIILVARYQIQLMPLLPIEAKFTITQSAATRGWLHGDGGELIGQKNE